MFNFLSTIYIFIPVSGCVGRGLRALLCPGSYNAVKIALARRLGKLMAVPANKKQIFHWQTMVNCN